MRTIIRLGYTAIMIASWIVIMLGAISHNYWNVFIGGIVVLGTTYGYYRMELKWNE